ncbi:hypothetical protein V9L05_01405 [Bernardetia sp. Wsw4-3y2]|uniref:helix-turn-helix domain-containing protein n=1 Tax=Bernardetia sp. Wsw4-3y2 TaxID=3127471 RepID=UPI0030CAA122
MTGTEAKKMRESFGLSQSDVARNLGYANRFSIARIEAYKEVPLNYQKPLENLCELMLLKSNQIKQDYKFQFSKKNELVFAHQVLRRVYSNNEESVLRFSQEINRDVKTRQDKLYKYEIIVF